MLSRLLQAYKLYNLCTVQLQFLSWHGSCSGKKRGEYDIKFYSELLIMVQKKWTCLFAGPVF